MREKVTHRAVGLAGALYSEINELILTINPVMLGAGTPLFRGASREATLALIHQTSFEAGVVIHHYRVLG